MAQLRWLCLELPAAHGIQATILALSPVQPISTTTVKDHSWQAEAARQRHGVLQLNLTTEAFGFLSSIAMDRWYTFEGSGHGLRTTSLTWERDGHQRGNYLIVRVEVAWLLPDQSR